MKRTLLTAAPLAVLLLLAGCVTAQQQTASDNDHCKSMGLKFGTPDFAQCRMLQDFRHDLARAQANQQFSEGLDMMAEGLSN
jgi:hypothetical protein